jgi:hypothetical protein
MSLIPLDRAPFEEPSAMEDRLSLADQDQLRDDVEELRLNVVHLPIEPGNVIILIERVFATLLGMAQLVTGADGTRRKGGSSSS